MIDEYEISSTNRQALGLADTPAALLLLARASDRATHYPANGARVIVGWADPSRGERWLADEPVLWFDDQGDPVTLPVPAEGGCGPESLRNAGGMVRWAVYHPESRRIGSDHEPREVAVAFVHEALDAHLSRTRGTA